MLPVVQRALHAVMAVRAVQPTKPTKPALPLRTAKIAANPALRAATADRAAQRKPMPTRLIPNLPNQRNRPKLKTDAAPAVRVPNTNLTAKKNQPLALKRGADR